MDTISVLFADDDLDLQQAVCFVLETAGMKVTFAEDGLKALEVWRSEPVDVAILDIVMPGIDGVRVCQMIRQKSEMPVILLTAKNREEDIVRGFASGADDYIVKPFRVRELVARVQALVRRSRGNFPLPKRRLSFRSLVLDLETRRVINQDKDIPVSPMEFRLLKYLMQNAGVVLSKEDLMRNVWGYSASAGDLNLIEATVRRLRKKVEIDPSQPNYIQTVWGAGYRFGE